MSNFMGKAVNGYPGPPIGIGIGKASMRNTRSNMLYINLTRCR